MTGTIYWILGNIKFRLGVDNKEIQVAELSDVIITETVIKFDWKANINIETGFVKLTKQSSSLYKGMASIIDGSPTIIVEGELYENESSYFIRGTWIEQTQHWTMFVEIKK